MTDMESPRKNNDCYFYYYSTCAKGDSCTFRHEPSALGCEVMCSFWKEGKCVNVHCNFRHMELRKNRKVIPCYWETQPGGCLKPHCPFMHQNPKGNEGILSDRPDIRMAPPYGTQPDFRTSGHPVDSLVVNFEEESDNESAPTSSPAKPASGNTPTNRLVKVKTLEEIRLEKIQAVSAAYYSYEGDNLEEKEQLQNDDLRQRIFKRLQNKTKPIQKANTAAQKKLSKQQMALILGDKSLLLQEHRKPQQKSTNIENTHNTIINKEIQHCNTPEIKIKTLQEIREERRKRLLEEEEEEHKEETEITNKKRKLSPITLFTDNDNNKKENDETEVSSTSNDEQMALAASDISIENPNNIITVVDKPLIRKLNLKRKQNTAEEVEKVSDIPIDTPKLPEHITDTIITSDSLNEKLGEQKPEEIIEESTKAIVHNVFEDVKQVSVSVEVSKENSEELKEEANVPEKSDVTKVTTEESLLLLDADEDMGNNVTLETEDDLLNEIDGLLND